jgi:hypothetical protein
MDEEYMLTTIDNPFNPFSEFEEWYAWDESHGYHTSSLLARETKTSDALSELDNSQAIDYAMNVIVKENLSGKHLKVKEDYVPRTLDK